MKNTFGTVILIAALIFSIIYLSGDDREKVIKAIESPKVEELRFFSKDKLDMKLKGTVAQQDEQGTYYVGEDWKKGSKSLNIIYMFNDEFDVKVSEADIELTEEVTVNGNRGFYINVDTAAMGENVVYEEVHFSLNGIYYKVGYQQKKTTTPPIGKEALVKLVEDNLF